MSNPIHNSLVAPQERTHNQRERCAERIQERLLAQKAEINRAIREYPLPITACDDQFNYLLEKRSTITQELGRLNRLLEESKQVNDADGRQWETALAEFIADSDFVSAHDICLTEAG